MGNWRVSPLITWQCDEVRPSCGKCDAYGVVCNYRRDVPDLHVASEKGQWRTGTLEGAADGGTGVSPSGSSSPPLGLPLATAFISADETSCLPIDAPSAEFLNLFRLCSATTLGGPAMREVCESHIMQLAFSVSPAALGDLPRTGSNTTQSPLLMHAALALAASHHRYLRNPRLTKGSASEIHHWAQCTALFNSKISSPIRPQDRDLLWTASINLGVVEFASLDAANPEEAWPLRPEPDTSDLRWIRFSAGKRAVWEATNPLREGSIFRPMAGDYARLHAPLPSSGMHNVPLVLQQLCGIDEASTAGNNPYYTAVQALSALAGVPEDSLSPVRALAFITHITPNYSALLERKDPVALLLLALWYAGAGSLAWWIERRAEVEGRSICLYLERYYWYEDAIMDVLPWRSPARFDDTWIGPKVFDDWEVMAEAGELAV